MKTHFSKYPEEDYDYLDYTACGAVVGEYSKLTSSWKYVDCKRCLKSKDKIIKTIQEEEVAIIEQMKGFVEFMKERDIEDLLQHS